MTAPAIDDGLDDELDPPLDPYRCRPCLARGDNCAWHRRLAVAIDLAFQLDLDPQDVTS